ncbi:MAG: response regulator [bacterium]|nr:response regulator [bacterium]
MKILIAEDDATSRRLLQAYLIKWGHQVIVCKDGQEAWDVCQTPEAPRLAILDWMMPELDGVEVCQKVRQLPHGELIYIILLTSKGEKADLIQGLSAGTDDYVTKPFDPEELKARIKVGQRVIKLQERLIEAERNRVLTEAVGGTAHEINQPLTVLIGITELIMYQMPDQDQHRENIETLHEAAQKISDIVKKMGKIRQYATKPYLEGIDIIDFDAAANAEETS